MVKKILLALLVLFVVLVIGIGILLATFDADRYKPQIEAYVASHYQRTLTIDGELALKVWPRLAISLPAISLSERESETAAASVNAASLSIDVLPLLRGAVVADKLRIDGLRARIVRHKDGSLNIDDLIGRDDASARAPSQADGQNGVGPRAIDIGGIEVTNAHLEYIDEASGQTASIDELEFLAGAISARGSAPVQLSFKLASAQPRAQATVQARGQLELDLPAGHAGGSGLQVELAGWAEPDDVRRVGLDLRASGIDANAEAFSIAKMKIDAHLSDPEREVHAQLSGPASGKLGEMLFELPGLSGSIDIEDAMLARGRLSLPLEASATADVGKEAVQLAAATTLEGSAIELDASLHHFAAPAISFRLDAGKLDLDRILAAPPPAQTQPQGSVAVSADESDPTIDLSPLAGLELDGTLAIEAIRARGLAASKLHADIKAHKGRLDVAPLAAELYEGTLAARLSAQAAGNRLAADVDLANIAIGPLLEALADKSLLEGRGTVKLQVRSAGASLGAVKRALAGTAAVALTDGAIRGIDLAATIRQAEALLGRAQPQENASDMTRKTDFSSLTISFDIADGVAHSTDLDMKSPLLRMSGAGQIDIGASTIDYTVRPSLVATSQGQGGRDRDALHGVTVPVVVSGALDAPGWAIDWTSVARDVLESKAGAQLRESLAPKADELREKRDAAREEIKDKATNKLRGLLR